MAEQEIIGSERGTALSQMLESDDIEPGSDPSYQVCKTIYLYHPLGAKMVDGPITVAQSQGREISVPNGPEERVKEAFLCEWKNIRADEHIANVMRQSRTYGTGAIVYGAKGVGTNSAIDNFKLPELELYFNVLDPLNTAGSLVLNQDPNAPDFQLATAITAAGVPYHPSRACVIMNESPIYIAYTSSAFGFVGRSVFQRALFPLKSFIQSMITDDLVTRKAGVIVAKIQQPGSIVNNMMDKAFGIKRSILKRSKNGDVLSIGHSDEISAIDLQNIDKAVITARNNILENIAAAADMPAQFLNSETFAEGFGEGTEDAKKVARYVDAVRKKMDPLYAFFDKIVQYRAWTPEFYATIQRDFPEYKKVPYKTAFMDWVNSFSAEWPSLLTEPDSEKVKVEDVKLKAIISVLEVLLEKADPNNKAILLDWASDNMNANKMMFTTPLILDSEAMANYEPPQPAMGNEPDVQEDLPGTKPAKAAA
ncbi:anti-CBASS protein Acb1 family protein [Martelella alba]|uniref:DUF1073 domain-containing protein n=1 Tax=Martelella alba TaxID=2590451 RepID=A0ABY2SF25_9HYPH|nr:anti-CBASS Acb1 family protein [Martelella alba]TKI02730.1 DUF1073 domain-containing protein [Martelella alba]